MRRYPKAMAVVGRKNSGKTTLLAGLAAELASRGHRVGAVKFSHHALDRADRDTGKLGEHAHAVVGMSPGETSLFLKEERSVQQMLPWMDVDVLLVEGGKHLTSLPRILTGSGVEQDQELDQGLALAVWGKDGTRLPGVDSLQKLGDLVMSRGFLLPELNCKACGRASCADLAREIVAGSGVAEDCRSMVPELEISVNGEAIALGPFVQRLLASTLNGMLEELKGYSPGSVTIRMER